MNCSDDVDVQIDLSLCWHTCHFVRFVMPLGSFEKIGLCGLPPG